MFRFAPFLNPEVQGYIRHILHVIGMMLVGYAGITEDTLELWVGASVSAISLFWFIGVSLYNMYKKKKAKEAGGCNCASEYCECEQEQEYSDPTPQDLPGRPAAN